MKPSPGEAKTSVEFLRKRLAEVNAEQDKLRPFWDRLAAEQRALEYALGALYPLAAHKPLEDVWAEEPPKPVSKLPDPPELISKAVVDKKPESPAEVGAVKPDKFNVADRVKEYHAWAEKEGIFTGVRMAGVFGLSSNTMNAWLRKWSADGIVERHGGLRGPNVFWTHKDYDGKLSIDKARGRKKLRSKVAAKAAPPKITTGVVTKRFDDWQLAKVYDRLERLGKFTLDSLEEEFSLAPGESSKMLDHILSNDMAMATGKRKGDQLVYAWSPSKVSTTKRKKLPYKSNGTPGAPSGRHPRSSNKDITQLLAKAERQGATVDRRGDEHFTVHGPKGKITVSSTPGVSALQAVKDDFRKIGLTP